MAPTSPARIDKCTQAIASAELAQSEKRGHYYVRGRAFEQIGDRLEAAQDYRAVLRIDPEHVAANARLEELIATAATADAATPEGATPLAP